MTESLISSSSAIFKPTSITLNVSMNTPTLYAVALRTAMNELGLDPNVVLAQQVGLDRDGELKACLEFFNQGNLGLDSLFKLVKALRARLPTPINLERLEQQNGISTDANIYAAALRLNSIELVAGLDDIYPVIRQISCDRGYDAGQTLWLVDQLLSDQMSALGFIHLLEMQMSIWATEAF